MPYVVLLWLYGVQEYLQQQQLNASAPKNLFFLGVGKRRTRLSGREKKACAPFVLLRTPKNRPTRYISRV
jgi:hypothetical protein